MPVLFYKVEASVISSTSNDIKHFPGQVDNGNFGFSNCDSVETVEHVTSSYKIPSESEPESFPAFLDTSDQIEDDFLDFIFDSSAALDNHFEAPINPAISTFGNQDDTMSDINLVVDSLLDDPLIDLDVENIFDPHVAPPEIQMSSSSSYLGLPPQTFASSPLSDHFSPNVQSPTHGPVHCPWTCSVGDSDSTGSPTHSIDRSCSPESVGDPSIELGSEFETVVKDDMTDVIWFDENIADGYLLDSDYLDDVNLNEDVKGEEEDMTMLLDLQEKPRVSNRSKPYTEEERRERKKASNRSAAFRYRQKQKAKVAGDQTDLKKTIDRLRKMQSLVSESRQSLELLKKLALEVVEARKIKRM